MKKYSSLCLFDIDGTLIRERVSRLGNYQQAISEIFGEAPRITELRTSGSTDYDIIRTLCRSIGHDPGGVDMERIIRRYLVFLKDDLQANPPEQMPDAGPFVQRLIQLGAAVGLATGNIEAGAKTKLASVGLSELFPTGGFSAPNTNRISIVSRAVEACQDHYGQKFTSIVLFGDTPADIEAASKNGLLSIAISGGMFSARDLAKVNPSLIIETFEDASLIDPFLAKHGVAKKSGGWQA